MEIKYTIEILTKDIQDIEKLEGNLRNSKGDSALELDLALSKLRNVYEILTIIKADRLQDLVSEKQLQNNAPAAFTAPEEPKTEEQPEAKTEEQPEAKTEEQPEAKTEESEPEPKTPATPGADQETAAEPVPADPSILAEKFSVESSINENLAEKRGNNIDAKLLGKPIDNISRNIGINDRFLIIRELFAGDSDKFSDLVSKLDNAENYEAAAGILNKQFAETTDHEGVEILTGLVKRRHIR
jgi:hypothetical protein